MGTMQRVRLYEKHISLFNNKGFRLHLKISLSGGDKKKFQFPDANDSSEASQNLVPF